MSTHSDILDALQDIHAGISGVTTAPTAMPGAIDTAMLPMVLVYPLASDHVVPWHAGRREDREWLVRLFVKPIGQGQGVDEGFQECLPFLDSFADAYHTTTNIVIATGEWRELSLVSDTGIRADLQLHGTGDQFYWGIEWTLIIKVKEAA